MRRALSLGLAVLAAGGMVVAPANAATSTMGRITANAPTTAPSGAAAVLGHGLAQKLAAATPATRLVVLVHGTSRDAAVHAVAAAGMKRLLVLESIGVPAAVGTATQIRSLLHQPGVTYVEADAPLALTTDTSVRATHTDVALRTFIDRAGKPRFTGAGHSIAIVDSGVDGTHPMFKRRDGSSKVVRNLKIVCLDARVAYVSTSNGQVPPNPCPSGKTSDPFLVDAPNNDSDTISVGGHGTHVASIAAGVPTRDGRLTLSGTAPGADLVAISTGYTVSVLTSDVALDWIARNHTNPCAGAGRTCNPITVVNNSYGSEGGGAFDPKSATAKITARLVAAKVVMVWANGNGDFSNDGGNGSDNRSNPEGQNPLGGVISVANYDDGGSGTRDGRIDPTSSRGNKTQPNTWPDLAAPGTNITAACRPSLAVCSSGESDPNFGTISGTSMASPHVAGIVALLQQARPGITPAQVETVLENTAYRFATSAPWGRDTRNLATVTPSSFDRGHGLVDTLRALQAVLAKP